MELWSKLRSLDAYPKVNEDFYSRTLSGGLITIVSSLAILLLFFSEIRLYLYAATESKLTVDTSRGERLHINFDVTFPALPCSLVAIDTMDVSGEQHYDIRHDIMKKRIDHLGNVIESRKDGVGSPKIERPLQNHGGRLDHNEVYCGSCYGSEESDDQCCNSCEEVRDSYRKKGWALTNVESIDQCKREGFVQRLKDEQGEGCNIHGFVDVNKVAGNFHFAPGKSLDHAFNFLQDMLNFQPENYNISHKINKLSFGKEFPGVINPLDGVEWKQEQTTGLTGMYQYFVKVVPTIYTDIRGRKIHSNQVNIMVFFNVYFLLPSQSFWPILNFHVQFSVTEHFREAIGLPRPPPGVYFFYEFSPIQVDFTEENTSLLHFLTNICAIVGGIFTVAGIIDSFVYHGHRAIKKKMEIGKLG
uniref:Endoplasmic reticulum-Golgi intermediate compartment protein 3 n=1 Tax=Triticum urartu TaxID=4572 RepID=A0A8R7U7W9_TRIUA